MRRPTASRISPMLLALVATALLAGGCASAASTRDEPVLSKREYIDRGNDLQTDAAEVFRSLDGSTAASPKAAGAQLAAFDELIDGYEELRPPSEWKDEHAALLESLRTMRQSMSIVSKASARNTEVITTQLSRFTKAQSAFEQAVRDINASR